MMSENPRVPHDLEQTVRWALCERVSDAEPSPSVWQNIRERIEDEPRPATRPFWVRLRMRPVLQAAAVGVAVLVLGAGVALSSHPLGTLAGGAGGSDGRRIHVSAQPRDALSGRLLWLAGRETIAVDYLRVRGHLR